MTGCNVLNPSLRVEAHFRASRDGEDLATIFPFDIYPDLARWLHGVIDYKLWRSGNLPGRHTIAPPPGGETLARLIRGGIVLEKVGADGRRALQLNPQHNIWLTVKARRAGGLPALQSDIPVYQDTETAKWILTKCAGAADAGVAGYPFGDEVQDRLAEVGVLVDEMPPGPAYFPDPEATVDVVADTAAAATCRFQPAGAPIPDAVAASLGRHRPAVPPDCSLIWIEDAGTGIVYPCRMPDDLDQDAVRAAAGRDAAARTALWESERESAARALPAKNFVALREIIPPAQRRMLRRYVRALVERGYFPALNDGQVKLRAALHNEPTIASLHAGLARLVSEIAGREVIASYCYLAKYEAGAVLERHRDRPQCLYNLSVVFDMDGPQGEPDPWPIWLDLDGKALAVRLEVGDGLLYSGTDIWHWRDALPEGLRAIVCFFHFVTPDFTGSLD